MIKVFRQPRVAKYISQVYRTGFVPHDYLSKKIKSRNIWQTKPAYPSRKTLSNLKWGSA